jgi:hypothetical protein
MTTGITIPTKPAADEATKKTLADAIIDALSAMDGVLDGVLSELIPNPSLEVYETGASVPSNWTRTLLQNGAGATETAEPYHGAKAYKFTRTSGASNGGGYLESEQFIPVGEGDAFTFYVNYTASAAIKSTCELMLYNAAQTLVSTTTLATIQIATCRRTLKATGYCDKARYAKLRLTGGTTDVDVAGYAIFDGIRFETAPVYPVLSGAEYSGTQDAYTTYETIPVTIPANATYLDVTVKLKNDTEGQPVYFRAKLNATTGTEQTATTTSYADKTSRVTIAAGDKGKTLILELQCKEPPGGYTYTMKTESDVSGGFEAKIAIT